MLQILLTFEPAPTKKKEGGCQSHEGHQQSVLDEDPLSGVVRPDAQYAFDQSHAQEYRSGRRNALLSLVSATPALSGNGPRIDARSQIETAADRTHRSSAARKAGELASSRYTASMPVQCAPNRFCKPKSFSLDAVQAAFHRSPYKGESRPARRIWGGAISDRAYSSVFTMPAWPQPEITTKPLPVTMTRDWSSGRLSSAVFPSARASGLLLVFQFLSGILARNRAGQPDAGEDLARRFVNDEFATRCLIFGPRGDHVIGFRLTGRRPAQENAVAHVGAR